MRIQRHGILILAGLLSMVGCTFSQVPNAYITPNKPAATGIAGTTAGAIATSGLPMIGIGMASTLVGKQLSRRALIADLRARDVIVITQGDTLRLVLSTDHFFEDNGVKLNPTHYFTLDYVAALLKEYGQTPIWIVGYTDNVGSEKQRKRLTLQQARSLLAYLWVHGVAFQHLYAVGRGSEHPVSSNDTPDGSHDNRRIEIHLRDGCPNPSVC